MNSFATSDDLEPGSTLTSADGGLELEGRPVPVGTELEMAVPGGWVEVRIGESFGGWLHAALDVRSGAENASDYLVRLRFGEHDAEFRWPEDRRRRAPGEGDGTGSTLSRTRGQWVLEERKVSRGSKVEIAVPSGWLAAHVVSLTPRECRLAIPARVAGEVPPERGATGQRYLVAECSPSVLRLRWPPETEDGLPGPEPDPPWREHLPPSRSTADFSPKGVQEDMLLVWHLGPESARPNRTGLIVTRDGSVMLVRSEGRLRDAMAAVPGTGDVEVYDLFDLAYGGVVKTTTHEMIEQLEGDAKADDTPPLSSRSAPTTQSEGGRLAGQLDDKFSWHLETAEGRGEQVVNNEVVEVATTGGWLRGTIHGLGTGRPPWLEVPLVPAPPLGGRPIPGKLFLPIDQVVVRLPPKRGSDPMVDVGEGGSLLPPPGSPRRRPPPPLPLPLSGRVPGKKRARKPCKLPITTRRR